MGLFRFYRECFARAFTGKFFLIEKWSGGLGLLVVLATRMLPIPDGWQWFMTDDLPLYFFLLVFFGTVFLGFVTAPYTIYEEQREKAFLLEMARKPRLEIFVASPNGDEFVGRGASNETGNGSRYTTFYDVERPVLCLVVRNSGETRTGNCIAKIIAAECTEGERKGPLQIIEPITLPWASSGSGSDLQAQLDPNEGRRLIVAAVRGVGHVWLLRDIANLAAQYQQVFGPSGTYRATIQISDGIAAPVTTEIEIIGAEGQSPQSGSREGFGKISILKQVVEPLPLKGTVTETLR